MKLEKSTRDMFVLVFEVAVLVLFGVIAGGLLARSSNSERDPETTPTATQSVEDSSVEAAPALGFTSGGEGSIEIPGFDRMTLKAGTFTAENDLLYNPAGNNCNFVFTLMLPDGTEFFRSGPIAPGKRLEILEMSQKLEIGTYENAILQYDCYALDTMEKLNGAKINFTLEVIP